MGTIYSFLGLDGILPDSFVFFKPGWLLLFFGVPARNRT